MDDTIKKMYYHYQIKNRLADTKKEIKNIYRYYIQKREETLLTGISSAVALNSIINNGNIDYTLISPQMEEAFHLQYPNKEISDLENMNPEQLEGIINGWSGKYFEVIVRDQLNAGQAVGDIQLEPGQEAVLADSPTQSRWDLQILNEDGTIATELQLKATESLSYVKNALEKYPDIQVLTTEEVFKNSEVISEEIINSGISKNELEASLREPMAALLPSKDTSFLEMVLPGLPVIIIAIGEGRHVLMGRRTFEEFLFAFIGKAAKSATAISIGWLSTYLIDLGLINGLITIGTYYALDRLNNDHTPYQHLKEKTNEVKDIQVYYSTS